MTTAQQVAKGWNSYASANKLRPGTQKYEQAQHAYLNGVHLTLQHETPPILTIYAMSGRDISELANEVVA